MALSLFIEKQSYASAITLAGAAEEVLGKEMVRRGQQPVLDWKFDQMGLVHELFHGKPLDRAKFMTEENLIRNALKHFDDMSSPHLTVDLEDAACWMLVRACENARRLGLNITNWWEFDNWFYENVVGI